jgi:hypothetical protein
MVTSCRFESGHRYHLTVVKHAQNRPHPPDFCPTSNSRRILFGEQWASFSKICTILLTFESDSVVFFQQRGGEMGRNSPPRLTVRNLSNGAWSESFQPADYTMRGIGEAQRNEIIALFPELEDRSDGAGWPSARKVLKKHEAQLLTS